MCSQAQLLLLLNVTSQGSWARQEEGLQPLCANRRLIQTQELLAGSTMLSFFVAQALSVPRLSLPGLRAAPQLICLCDAKAAQD